MVLVVSRVFGFAFATGFTGFSVILVFFVAGTLTAEALALAAYRRARLRSRLAFLAARRAANEGIAEASSSSSSASADFLCVPTGSTRTGIMTISEPGGAGVCTVMAWIWSGTGCWCVLDGVRRPRLDRGAFLDTRTFTGASSVDISRLYYVTPLITSAANDKEY